MWTVARLATALVLLSALSPSIAAAQTSRAGVVTTLEGNVTVTRVALPPQPLKFKDDVFVDDKVTTGDRSLARMLLGGKAVVTVRERSVLTITEVPGKATIDLSAGKIAVAVATSLPSRSIPKQPSGSSSSNRSQSSSVWFQPAACFSRMH